MTRKEMGGQPTHFKTRQRLCLLYTTNTGHPIVFVFKRGHLVHVRFAAHMNVGVLSLKRVMRAGLRVCDCTDIANSVLHLPSHIGMLLTNRYPEHTHAILMWRDAVIAKRQLRAAAKGIFYNV